MFGRAAKTKLKEVGEVLTRSQRGIFKRIDENRELVELLRERAPDFLKEHFWVEGWLRSQDEFLSELSAVMPVANPVPTGNFPRPWPVAGAIEAAPAARDLSRPSGWGLPDDIAFRVTRGSETSPIPCTFDQMLDFLDACGLDPAKDETQVAGIIAGVPFHIDGAQIQFQQIWRNGAELNWAMHAHPLKQITIRLQGTRHSEPESMLQQLDEVAARIKQGDQAGEASDDDFGYQFSVEASTTKPSIFGNAPATGA